MSTSAWRPPSAFLWLSLTVLAGCAGSPQPAPTDVPPAVSLGNVAALRAPVGQAATATLSLTSSDSRSLTYTVSSDSDWLSVTSGASGALSPGQQASLALRAQCGPQADERVGHLTLVAQEAGAAAPRTATLSGEVHLSCTAMPSTTPDAFNFEPQVKVAPGSSVTSNTVTISGISAPAPVTVQGATLLVNGQPSTQTSLQPGDQVALRLTAPDTYATSVTASLTVGGVEAHFNVTTLPAPGAPLPGPLLLSTTALQFTALGADQRQSLTASQQNASGPFTVSGSCQNIATLTPLQSTPGALTLAVTPLAAGRCVIWVSSATDKASINVSVTTSGVVVN